MNGNTYLNGRGTAVELVVDVGAGDVVDVGATTVVLVDDVAGAVVESPVAASPEQPEINMPITIAFRRACIVHQPVTADLPLQAMNRIACLAVGITLLAAGCNVDEGSTSPQTLPPLGTPSNTVPPTTVTTVPATAPAAIATSTIALPTGACVFSPPGPTPEVTFEIGTRLYSVSPGGATTGCLTELTRDNVGPIRWSPTGDRVLLNSVTVFDGTQALPSGYLSSNTRVTWSYPTGKALIAPAVADDHLLWRTAGKPETRTDISFLERTDVAAYHPAGKNIFAAGQASDGTAGLFIAGNRGQNPRIIAQLDQPATVITEIDPDPSG
ncbi:MAG: hypothetical protein ABI949_13955, partial [Ilumatobacteraceae bacterium]